MADWGAIVGVAGTVVAALSFWKSREANQLARKNALQSEESVRLSKEANSIAQSANSYSREANALAESANEFSKSANETATKALNLEYEPRISVAATIGYWKIEQVHIPIHVIRVSNTGKLAIELSSAEFRFLPSLKRTNALPLSIFRKPDTVELPRLVEPGRTVDFCLDGKDVDRLLAYRIERGDSEFRFEVGDKADRHYASEPVPIKKRIAELEFFFEMLRVFYGIDDEGKMIPRHEWGADGLWRLWKSLPSDPAERYELISLVYGLIGEPIYKVPFLLDPPISDLKNAPE